MKNVKVMILSGEGINCEQETAKAFENIGAHTSCVHIREWIKNPNLIYDFHILALPGGFSFGDELHSGQILAQMLKYSVGDAFQKFLDRQGLVIGICNGFQVLMKMGAFENFQSNRQMTLYHNDKFQFIDRWVGCLVPESHCVWTKGISKLELPIRHGEGRIIVSENKLPQGCKAALYYDEDVNGSFNNIAGLTDDTGQILGLMPHPEAALKSWLYPENLEIFSEQAQQIFTNAVLYCQERL